MPIARMDSDVSDPTREQNPILVGRNNRLVQDLVKIGRAQFADLRAGEGVVQIVPRAFGNLTATVVAGADAGGHRSGERVSGPAGALCLGQPARRVFLQRL